MTKKMTKRMTKRMTKKYTGNVSLRVIEKVDGVEMLSFLLSYTTPQGENQYVTVKAPGTYKNKESLFNRLFDATGVTVSGTTEESFNHFSPLSTSVIKMENIAFSEVL